MFAFRGSPDAQDDRSDERCATKERQATNETGSRMDGTGGRREAVAAKIQSTRWRAEKKFVNMQELRRYQSAKLSHGISVVLFTPKTQSWEISFQQASRHLKRC